MSEWSITSFLEPHLDKISDQLKHDRELREAFSSAATGGEYHNFAFAITAIASAPDSQSPKHESIIVHLRCPSPESEPFNVSITSEIRPSDDKNTNPSDAASFTLNAKPEHWEQFFPTNLSSIIRPFQSYWGMLRTIGSDNQVFISGDTAKFARYARVWRITLDRIRLVIAGQVYDNSIPDIPENNNDSDSDIEDSITGSYTWISHNTYGKVKIFYESSGNGPQNILFLHTAGSDSRQYHSLMNNPGLRGKCNMYAFDLPGHGRSSLGTKQSIDTYALTENDYIESIDKVLQKIGKKHGELKNLIVSGASMAGHICLALAIHTGSNTMHTPIRGVIPLEGCAHLPTPAAIYNLGSTSAPPSLLDPEKVCGMISPTSPEYFKRQIWWQYSSQANGIFAGDLRFYFKGWDGRGRLEGVDTGVCPVYMLTGEYDYSCTCEASEETARLIGREGKGGNGDGGGDGGREYVKGVMFEKMKGLGHFPLTESPGRVLPYLERTIEFIQRERTG